MRRGRDLYTYIMNAKTPKRTILLQYVVALQVLVFSLQRSLVCLPVQPEPFRFTLLIIVFVMFFFSVFYSFSNYVGLRRKKP